MKPEALATAAAVLLASSAALADLPDIPAFTTHDELSMSHACVHEVTWAGGERTEDCGAMLQVILLRRRDEEPFSGALARTMPRFTAGTTSRSWAAMLPPGPLPIGLEIPGWVAPERPAAHSASWLAVQARVHAYMTQGEPLPCAQNPWHWFSPREDGEQIDEHLSSGRWIVADCGTVSNVYLARVDPE